MKRRFIPLVLCLLLLMTCLTGCGGDGGGATRSASLDSFAGVTNSYQSYDDYDMAEEAYSPAPSAPKSESGSMIEESRKDVKRIYSASLSLETTQFATAVSAIENLANKAGGYLEYNNSYTRTRYFSYGESDYYVASISIRVPVENFNSLLTQISDTDVISVVGKNVSAQDVSESYYDIQMRLRLAREKVEKLEALLDQAETIDEILSVENSLDDALYQVEYLQGQINSYDSRIEYSRIDIDLTEVTALTMTARTAGYGNKLTEGFKTGFTNGVEFFADLLLAIVSSWLVLLVLVIVIIIIVRIGKRGHKKRKAERALVKQQKDAEREARMKEMAELKQILAETNDQQIPETQENESNSDENL